MTYLPSDEYSAFLEKILKKYGDYKIPYPQIWDDGGRLEAGEKGFGFDCATRAITLVTELPYPVACRIINKYCREHEKIMGKGEGEDYEPSSVESGIHSTTLKKMLINHFGMKWTRQVTTWQKIKFPAGRHIVSLEGHVTTVIDGIIYDSVRCSSPYYSRIFGYYTFDPNFEIKR